MPFARDCCKKVVEKPSRTTNISNQKPTEVQISFVFDYFIIFNKLFFFRISALKGNIWFSNEPVPGPEPILPRKLRSPYH